MHRCTMHSKQKSTCSGEVFLEQAHRRVAKLVASYELETMAVDGAPRFCLRAEDGRVSGDASGEPPSAKILAAVRAAAMDAETHGDA